jgi:hypothetical protein
MIDLEKLLKLRVPSLRAHPRRDRVTPGVTTTGGEGVVLHDPRGDDRRTTPSVSPRLSRLPPPE